MTSLLSSTTLANVKTDSLYFGSAMLTAQLVSQKSVTDRQWLMASFLTLVGFATYQIVVARLVKPNISSTKLRNTVNDFLKAGTMMVVSRFLSGQPLDDQVWLQSSAATLVGFATFNFVTSSSLDVIDLSSQSNKIRNSVYDIVKLSTVFSVQNWLLGNEFNREWMLQSGGFIAGIVAYHHLLA